MRAWVIAAGIGLAMSLGSGVAHGQDDEWLQAPGERADSRVQWVQPASLQSPESIRRMIATAATNGVQSLFLPIRTAHPEGFDAVAQAISAARERGMRIYAWVSVNMVSAASELPASREHVIYQHPDWLMVPRELAPQLLGIDTRSPEYLGRLARWTRANVARVKGLFVSPLHTGAHVRLAAELKEIVTRYAVDGVHLEEVRFPGADFDYSRSAIEAFRASIRGRLTPSDRSRLDAIETIDPYAYPDELPEEWRLFRQTQMTSLITRLRSTVKAIRPDISVTASVLANAAAAARDGFQDWRTWVDNGFIDALRPLGGLD